MREHFADPDRLVKGGDTVPLAAIRSDTESGRKLVDEARALLQVVGKPDADEISLADLTQRVEVLSASSASTATASCRRPRPTTPRPPSR